MKIRNAVITICCTFLIAFFIAYFDIYKTFRLINRNTKCNIICGMVLVVLVIFSLDKPLKRISWNRVLFWLFFYAGAGIVAISFLHPIGNGYRSFGLMMMFGFPCLYYVWNNRGDHNTLYFRLSLATSLVGFIFYCTFAVMALRGDVYVEVTRVAGFFINSNMFSMIGMIMVCTSTYLFFLKRGDIRWFIINTATYAMGWDIVILGVSRASALICMGSVFAAVVFIIKNTEGIKTREDRSRMLKKIGIILVAVLLLDIVGAKLVDINSTIQYKQEVLEQQALEQAMVGEQAAVENVAPEQTPIENAAPEQTPADSVETVPEDEIEVPDEVIDNNSESLAQRFSVVEGGDFSGGRLAIWHTYAEHLNLLGNSFDVDEVKIMNGGYISHAHNNFLEYAYRCGVPVACLHILLELFAGVASLIFLFKKEYRNPEYLFTVIFMICYTVESMLDIATLAFERPAPFFFYIILITVFGSTKKDYERDGK